MTQQEIAYTADGASILENLADEHTAVGNNEMAAYWRQQADEVRRAAESGRQLERICADLCELREALVAGDAPARREV